MDWMHDGFRIETAVSSMYNLLDRFFSWWISVWQIYTNKHIMCQFVVFTIHLPAVSASLTCYSYSTGSYWRVDTLKDLHVNLHLRASILWIVESAIIYMYICYQSIYGARLLLSCAHIFNKCAVYIRYYENSNARLKLYSGTLYTCIYIHTYAESRCLVISIIICIRLPVGLL